MTWKRYVDKVGYKAIFRAEKMEQFYVSCVEMSKKTSETSTLKLALLLHEVRCFTSDVPFDLQTATYMFLMFS